MSTPTTTPPLTRSAHAELADILAPCSNCGVRLTECFTEAAARKALNLRAEMMADPERARIAHVVESIPYMCQSCASRLEFAGASERRRVKLDGLYQRTYNSKTGLLPRIAKPCTFEDSRADVEARNPGVWLKAHKVPLAAGLWLCGEHGTGKTHLARCVANHYLEAGKSAAEITGIALNELATQFQMIPDLTRYTRAALLIIDDIDKATWKPRGIDALLHVVNARHGTGRMNIVTANVLPPVMFAALDEVRDKNASNAAAIRERMLPMDIEQMTGDNLRREDAAKEEA